MNNTNGLKMNMNLLAPASIEFPYCWLVKKDGYYIGVHLDDGWCTRSIAGHVVLCSTPDGCLPLEPLLEIEHDTFFSFLRDSASATSASPYAQKILAFPKRELLKFVLNSNCSDYWPLRALSWINMDTVLIQDLIVDLEIFFNNKAMSQQARHLARKLINMHR